MLWKSSKMTVKKGHNILYSVWNKGSFKLLSYARGVSYWNRDYEGVLKGISDISEWTTGNWQPIVGCVTLQFSTGTYSTTVLYYNTCSQNPQVCTLVRLYDWIAASLIPQSSISDYKQNPAAIRVKPTQELKGLKFFSTYLPTAWKFCTTLCNDFVYLTYQIKQT